jgi:hypothetical protein
MSCIPSLLRGLNKVNDRALGDKQRDVNVVKTYPNAMAKFTRLFIQRESPFQKKKDYSERVTHHATQFVPEPC